MSSAYTQAADQLKIILDATYAPEGIVAIHDDIHESLGWNGPRIGINPDDRGDVLGRNALVQETWIQVKFYGTWVKEITPETVVDPREITEMAERFRRAIEAANQPATGVMWYYLLRQITYPRDPNGNRTRFVALLQAYGNNASLVETTG
jgi:hypothetical protein